MSGERLMGSQTAELRGVDKKKSMSRYDQATTHLFVIHNARYNSCISYALRVRLVNRREQEQRNSCASPIQGAKEDIPFL